jgi:hypothetical protein
LIASNAQNHDVLLNSHTINVDVPDLVGSLNRTPIFDCYMWFDVAPKMDIQKTCV